MDIEGGACPQILGETPCRLNVNTLAHFRIYPLFTVRPLPVSSTDFLHFFLTAELQDFALFSPVHDGMQLFLDALWGNLPAHTHRGGCVHWGATPALVLSLGLGYVFFPATFPSVCIFTIFFYSWSQRRVRGLGLVRNGGTQVGAGVQSPRELGRSPSTSSYGLWPAQGSVQRRKSMCFCGNRPANRQTNMLWLRDMIRSSLQFYLSPVCRESHILSSVSPPSRHHSPSSKTFLLSNPPTTPPVKSQVEEPHWTIDTNNFMGPQGEPPDTTVHGNDFEKPLVDCLNHGHFCTYWLRVLRSMRLL